MIGCAFLYRISQALSLAKENNEPFGGINVIFAGDFAQLSPVGDASLCSQVKTERVSTTAGQNIVFGKLLWLSVQTVILLSEVKRQQGTQNARFVTLLSRLRSGACNDDDFDLLNTRLASNLNLNWSDERWSKAPLIVCNNETKDALNERMTSAFGQRSNQHVQWYMAED
ncbi:hypothetical protein EV360DRAFT_15386, partial [Lentinula raphanica]